MHTLIKCIKIVTVRERNRLINQIKDGIKMAVFKSYLRKLARDLKDLRAALKEKDYEKAEKLLDNLIADTQADIED